MYSVAVKTTLSGSVPVSVVDPKVIVNDVALQKNIFVLFGLETHSPLYTVSSCQYPSAVD
jgi:hypothetical protein